MGEGRALVIEGAFGIICLQVSVPVTNTGSDTLYLDESTLNVEDASGNLVESLSYVPAYPMVLLPGETGWYSLETMLDEVPADDLTVVPELDVKVAEMEPVRFEVSDFVLGNAGLGGIRMEGNVVNTSDETVEMTYVAAQLYDENDPFLGLVLSTLTDVIEPGGSVPFTGGMMTGPEDLKVETVARYELFAYPFQFQG